MKKLLLLFTCVLPAVAMEKPKTKHAEIFKGNKINYIKHTAITPFRITAFDGDIKVGYIKFGINPRNTCYGHIEYLHVDTEYRGKRIGYTLFEKAIFSLIKKGFDTITCDITSLENVPLEKLEEIYLTYLGKLKCKLEFEFSMGKLLGFESYAIRPLKILVKNVTKKINTSTINSKFTA